MQNKLTDLNNHLFEQLERLNDESLTGEALEQEIGRAKAITSVSSQIIANADLNLKAVEMQLDYGYGKSVDLPGYFLNKKENDNAQVH